MFDDFDAIAVGDEKRIYRKINSDDVRKFVEMSGDDNPLHVDRSFAEKTSFKDVVVHGMLGASFISTVIGTKLPGPGALWISQNLDFLLPVRLGDELRISAVVIKKHNKERLLELATSITNQHGQEVLSGSGKVKVLRPSSKRIPLDTDTPRLACRTAIVTGGSGGIGKELCKRLAREGLNVVVHFNGNESQALDVVAEINARSEAATDELFVRKTAGRAFAVQADISTVAGVERLYERAVSEFESIDVIVNNASPKILPKSILELSWSDFQKQLDIQLKSAFLLTQLAAPRMVAARWGRIVNITTQAIDGPPTLHWTAYAAAKSALGAFSKYMAMELGPDGVTVNCIAPGMCDTPLIGGIPEKVQLITARQTPVRRLAQPIDIANAMAYLISDEASFVTGETIGVNGGMVMR